MKGAHALVTAIVFASLGLVAGCNSSKSSVSGVVLVDGAPLKTGEIVFEEADRSVAPSAGKIVDGKYTLHVLPGSKIIRIRASRISGTPDPLMGNAPSEAMIAEEFNVRSTLRAEIKPGSNGDVDFQVRSIPPR